MWGVCGVCGRMIHKASLMERSWLNRSLVGKSMDGTFLVM